MLYDILAVVVSAAIVILIIYLIPMVIQIRRTARSAERFFDVADENLNPLLIELRQTASQANKISSGASEGIDKVVNFLEAVEEMGETIKILNSVVRGGSSSFLVTSAALTVGIRKGLKVFFKELLKGGSNNGQ